MQNYIKAGKFKACVLKLMDEVRHSKRKIIITKRNIPVVQILPMEDTKKNIFGAMKVTIHVNGDIIKPMMVG